MAGSPGRGNQARRRWRHLLVMGLLALLLAAPQVMPPAPLAQLKDRLFDTYQRWQPRPYVAAPVRIVALDDASLARLGQWPWPRTRVAELVARLAQAGAATIAFDVVFAEPDRTAPAALLDDWPLSPEQKALLADLPDPDAVLAQVLGAVPTVLGYAATDDAADQPPALPSRIVRLGEAGPRLAAYAGAVSPLPVLAGAAPGLGFLNFQAIGDGVVRRVPLMLEIAGRPAPSLVVETLRVAQGTPNLMLGAEPEGGVAALRVGGLDLTDDLTLTRRVWMSPPRDDRYLPAWTVLDGSAPGEALAGHLVLIGATAQGLKDLRLSPLGDVIPGVEIHAQLLESILNDQHLVRPVWAPPLEAAATVLGGAAVGAGVIALPVLAAAGLAVLVAGLLAGAGAYLYAGGALLVDGATPGLAVLGVFAVGSVLAHLAARRDERFLKEAFKSYVSPNLVEHLVRHPDALALGGERRVCSFVFTDLAGFTSLMESMDPGRAVSLLNAYLDRMIAIAFEHEGTLDRIVGDAVAILFSAPLEQPDHAPRAVACALAMDRFATAYAAEVRARGEAFGDTRIGVHSGEVIIGNFGGGTVFDYRALGDPVNTASRLEGANKHLGTRLCVSGATVALCPDFIGRPIAELMLKGKSLPIEAFQPLSAEQADDPAIRHYQKAYRALAAGDRARASHLFDELAVTRPDDPLISLHRRRLAEGADDTRFTLPGK
ncbi:CHASE2 domain-containing protein [Roseospirillum parvum]|uniref:Adenylate cyclase n=1 Tax=Roseospirillum parvum TaxID=83401 RepID=A0A1G7V5N4_9PROT|nr:adenylate/guanylate cyclase domain-containing protein [Roseospirillum parvum]SDG55073.1 adenylate cyclase [Roseospirillum parvum]